MAKAGDDHGGHPDMTPMLDLVMQLLMYFILCANFLGQEVNAELVKLPDSAAAVPLDKREGDILFINITGKNEMVMFGKPPLDMANFEYELSKAAAAAPKDPENRILTTVILRADAGTDYGVIFQVLTLCKKMKFR